MKIDFPEAFRVVGNEAAKRLPGILTAVGIGGMFAAIADAIRSTPKAMRAIDLAKSDKHASDVNPKPTLNPYEVLKVSWKYYIRTALLATASTACLIGGQHVNARRNAALATACTLSDQAFREYQRKVVETIGEKKEEKIRADVAQDRVIQNVSSGSTIVSTGRGQTLCYDVFTGRLFYSDIEFLRKCVNNLNERMVTLHRDYISLNDWYYEVGLEPVPIGDDLGWNLNYSGCIELEFDSVLLEGTPCLSVSYRVMPKYGYQ